MYPFRQTQVDPWESGMDYEPSFIRRPGNVPEMVDPLAGKDMSIYRQGDMSGPQHGAISAPNPTPLREANPYLQQYFIRQGQPSLNQNDQVFSDQFQQQFGMPMPSEMEVM